MSSWNASIKYSRNALALYQGTTYTSLANSNQGNVPLYSPAWWTAGIAPSGGVTSVTGGTGVTVAGSSAVTIQANLGITGTGMSIDPGPGDVLNFENTGVVGLVSGPGIKLNSVANQRTPQTGVVDIDMDTSAGTVTGVTGANGTQVSPTTGAVVVTGASVLGDSQTVVAFAAGSGSGSDTWTVKPSTVTAGGAGIFVDAVAAGAGGPGTLGTYKVSNTGVRSVAAGSGISVSATTGDNVSIANTGVLGVSIAAGSGLAVTSAAGVSTLRTARVTISSAQVGFIVAPFTNSMFNYVISGGGGGGCGGYTNPSGPGGVGGGGGSSGETASGYLFVPQGKAVYFSVGAGGAGSAGNGNTSASNGGSTSITFANYVKTVRGGWGAPFPGGDGGGSETQPLCDFGGGSGSASTGVPSGNAGHGSLADGLSATSYVSPSERGYGGQGGGNYDPSVPNVINGSDVLTGIAGGNGGGANGASGSNDTLVPPLPATLGGGGGGGSANPETDAASAGSAGGDGYLSYYWQAM